MNSQPDNSRWRILALVILTNLLIIAMPAIITSLLGGVIGDKFGSKPGQ